MRKVIDGEQNLVTGRGQGYRCGHLTCDAENDIDPWCQGRDFLYAGCDRRERGEIRRYEMHCCDCGKRSTSLDDDIGEDCERPVKMIVEGLCLTSCRMVSLPRPLVPPITRMALSPKSGISFSGLNIMIGAADLRYGWEN